LITVSPAPRAPWHDAVSVSKIRREQDRRGMSYLEHAPSPALAPYVACFWSLSGQVAPGEERERAVVPDACMDILFNLASTTPGSLASQVVGTMTRPLPVRETGTLDLLGIRFRAGGATPFLRLPAQEITDGALQLDDLWGPEAATLTDRLREAGDTPTRLRILEDALLRHLSARAGEADTRVLAAAGLAEATRGTADVEALVDATGLGRRQLERRFLAVVGISPKTALRVIRFQHALTRLRQSPDAPLSWVALEAGYHDQAHFTREFRELAGETPGAYRRNHPPEGGL
jgi:AraC-like DNA-binding protein